MVYGLKATNAAANKAATGVLTFATTLYIIYILAIPNNKNGKRNTHSAVPKHFAHNHKNTCTPAGCPSGLTPYCIKS